MEKLLEIKDLHTYAKDDETKEILKGLNLRINKGEIHVIMGPNGSGKSTLANTCFHSPKYEISSGSIKFDGEIINDKSTDYIARKGMFMSFQTPVEIPGVSVASFLKAIKTNIDGKKISMPDFYKEVNEKIRNIGLSPDYASRELNVGFSGGEKKKLEILQLLMLNPKLAILDETDSGLDVDAVKIISKGVNLFKNESNSILIITHSTSILEYLDVDKVHILYDGRIIKTGDMSLANYIVKNGYAEFIENEN